MSVSASCPLTVISLPPCESVLLEVASRATRFWTAVQPADVHVLIMRSVVKEPGADAEAFAGFAGRATTLTTLHAKADRTRTEVFIGSRVEL